MKTVRPTARTSSGFTIMEIVIWLGVALTILALTIFGVQWFSNRKASDASMTCPAQIKAFNEQWAKKEEQKSSTIPTISDLCICSSDALQEQQKYATAQEKALVGDAVLVEEGRRALNPVCDENESSNQPG